MGCVLCTVAPRKLDLGVVAVAMADWLDACSQVCYSVLLAETDAHGIDEVLLHLNFGLVALVKHGGAL